MAGRRHFLKVLGRLSAAFTAVALRTGHAGSARQQQRGKDSIRLFLCGDVMTGRAIDQVLLHPSKPQLYEPKMRSALGYLALAEESSGRIRRPVSFPYVWGDALAELERRTPDARIINLETSVTRSDKPWPKVINYRMHPDNIGCLTAARIDCCALANNHVLDWQREGLSETLATLQRAHVAAAGAGVDLEAAQAPAILPSADGERILIFAAATEDSGVPADWAATATRSGVHRLPDLSPKTTARISALVQRYRHEGDRVLFSVHWGGNWGYAISREQRAFAHALIDEAGVDIVQGHSSHHPKAIEVYRHRLVLYGCGDFLNDYEGIGGHEEFRGELGLMYFPTLDSATGRLRGLELVPTRIRHFRVNRADGEDRAWLLARLRREYTALGCDLDQNTDGAFVVRWRSD
jgi:poly-gamma-glutamate capsule biosynthesis protein CapA/YwtB (metallophosphatase superfamily)